MKKRHDELQLGDVITIRAPFEENTPTYYNGHDVIAVRGEEMSNQFGQTGKYRPVMVISSRKDELIYIPLTTSTGGDHDHEHQYQLLDNSEMPKPKFKDDFETYAEVTSVRTIPSREYYKSIYHGRIKEQDLENLKTRMTQDALNLYDGFDSYKYATPQAIDKINEVFSASGYEIEEHENSRIYKQENREFTVSDDGVIFYHFRLSLEAVQRRQARIEHREMPIKQPEEPLNIDDFEQAIEELEAGKMTL